MELTQTSTEYVHPLATLFLFFFSSFIFIFIFIFILFIDVHGRGIHHSNLGDVGVPQQHPSFWFSHSFPRYTCFYFILLLSFIYFFSSSLVFYSSFLSFMFLNLQKLGLADGRTLWNSLHNRTHPLGVSYETVYQFLNCLEISPCWVCYTFMFISKFRLFYFNNNIIFYLARFC